MLWLSRESCVPRSIVVIASSLPHVIGFRKSLHVEL